VKPAWFDYYAPRELEEALRILGDAGQDGRVLAGGQSLMPMLNLRILSPAVIVDINRIEALNRLHVGSDSLTVGALVRHADLLRSPLVREGWPLLAEATTQVAHMAIRNRGTVCGSVSHNDPSAEHPSVLVTMGGTVVIAGRGPPGTAGGEIFAVCCQTRWNRVGGGGTALCVLPPVPARRSWSSATVGDHCCGRHADDARRRLRKARLTIVGMRRARFGPMRWKMLNGQRLDRRYLKTLLPKRPQK
jgi:carbon-monoxide dehydrogenase medium subunit